MARTFKAIVDDRHDRLVFIGAFALGVAAILLLRLFLSFAWLYVAAPSAILLAYGAYVVFTARASVSLDRAGDNVYYLGLLFTLVSLSISLVQVGQDNTASGLALELIGGFGVALASTILGMFLRVLLQQLRYDPVDVERSARIELSEASSKLRTELYGVTADLNSYRRAITQSLAEVSQEITQTIRSTSEDSSSAIKSAATGLEHIAANLKGVEGMVTRLASAEANAVNTAAKLDGITTATSEAVESLRRSAEQHLNVLRGLTGEDVAASVGNAVRQLESAVGTTAKVTQNLEAASSILKDAAKAISDDQADLRQMNQRVAEAQAMVAQVQNGLVSAVRTLREEVRRA